MQANYIGLIVGDVAAATAFYHDQLGWPINKAESIPGIFTQFDLAGDCIVALQAQSEVPGGQRFEPALKVDDIDKLYAQWKAQGIELLDEPNDKPFGRTFVFRTPAGHVWRVYSTPRADLRSSPVE